jgi:iron complex outermembrane receptor protein
MQNRLWVSRVCLAFACLSQSWASTVRAQESIEPPPTAAEAEAPSAPPPETPSTNAEVEPAPAPVVAPPLAAEPAGPPATAPTPPPVAIEPPEATSSEPPLSPAADSGDEAGSSYRAVAVAPGPFSGIDLDDVPRNVLSLDGDIIADRHGLGLSDALNARLSSATLTDVQNNPLQPDFQYRGFTASPLLGTPQGLAVYQNGVRINEPFGDLLQWDLVPTFALAEVELLPGANPIYGLNALGGSMVLRMKDGFRAPGYRVEASTGSFARNRTNLEYGHAFGNWAFYAGGSLFAERGFRDHSRSNAKNLYADLRHRSNDHEVGASLTLGSARLNGNGPAPIELLEQDRAAVFTWPDTTINDLWMVNVDGRKTLSERVALLGLAYLRHLQRDTINGDEGEFAVCTPEDSDTSVLCEDDEPLQDEALRTIPTSEAFNAVYNTTTTSSDGLGGSLQLDVRERLLSRPNRFVAGASYDGAYTTFLQRAEVGFLTANRTVQGAGFYLSGDEFSTDLHVRDHSVGVYASDTFRVLDPLAINVAARMNWYQTTLDDRVGEALDGKHDFTRLNPSVGATLRIVNGLTLFASYGESNRAPTASELACADPDEPCRLPNAFVADPPLEQVVSRSVELGLRGRIGSASRPWLQASMAGFATRNQDDILFVAGTRIGTGYFRNAGDTQRVGLEITLTADNGPLRLYAGYTLLRATFESDLTLPGGAHPSLGGEEEEGEEEEEEEGGALAVEKGSRIPGLPTHSVKAGIALRPLPELEVGVSMIAQSSQPFRGDEANLLRGVAGFAVFNAHVSYQVFPALQLFVRANNLLDTEYNTFGILGEPDEVLAGTSNPRFYGVGAPFGVWVGAVLAEVP